MRDVTYFVAASLDGFIARLDESINWLFMDDDYGFDEFYRSVDAVVMGRRTFEVSLNVIEYPYAGKRAYVFSRTLTQSPHPDAEVVSEDPARFVKKLKSSPGGRIWVVGGGGIASALLQAGLVDELIVTIHPITLGQGVPLFERHGTEQRWTLYSSRAYHNGLLQATWRRTPRDAG
ncbi:MAG TPA: dihydrofolate reductase family protein [Candidatus Krumholzibacteria bacterium]|nr:dihydrofolate reductase family protein [Candidatus Krumholzibacteria bacterium]